MNKYLNRPISGIEVPKAKYEIYNLSENPFPSSPFVNPNSSDARSNGEIYEPSIRRSEYNQIKENFIQVPQTDPNHLRLGYIIDTSYIGRGNGKSAFLVNLQRSINQDFGLNLSNQNNKCFSLIITPEPGGKTKTFENFVDLFANSIFSSNIIDDSLATLRLEAILSIDPDFNIDTSFENEDDLRTKLNSITWFNEKKIDFRSVNDIVIQNKYLQDVPHGFPIYTYQLFLTDVPNQKSFVEYYKNIKRSKERIEFIFSDIVNLFMAAGFNGAYIFVDDFERIPDFQSERQKRDFALELRTCLFDGLYKNAKIGFYNILLVLHAGVPRLIQEAWDQSGLEQRSPIFSKFTPKHVIRFEKINLDDTYSLIKKYLNSYRIDRTHNDDSIVPFTNSAIERMAELSEFNASKILKMSYEILDQAASKKIETIDANFLSVDERLTHSESKQQKGIGEAQTKNLDLEEDI